MAAESVPYWMLFAMVLLDGLGLPLAAEFALAGAGVAVRAGLIDPGAGFAVAAAATLAGHCAAYWAGRLLGWRVLPAAARFQPGPVAVLFSRFLVGIRVVLCPLAGIARMRFRVFLLLDAAGACVWVAAFMLLGYAGGAHLDLAREVLEGTRATVLVALTTAAAALVLPVLLRRARPAVRAS